MLYLHQFLFLLKCLVLFLFCREVSLIPNCDRFIIGGRIVLVTREQHLQAVDEYRDRLEPLMDRLEAEGKWKKIERKIFKGFFLDKDGIMWKYQVQ